MRPRVCLGHSDCVKHTARNFRRTWLHMFGGHLDKQTDGEIYRGHEEAKCAMHAATRGHRALHGRHSDPEAARIRRQIGRSDLRALRCDHMRPNTAGGARGDSAEFWSERRVHLGNGAGTVRKLAQSNI